MSLNVTVPISYAAERDYILSVILKHFLGLDYVVQRTCVKVVCISDKDNERCLVIPDGLFALPQSTWLTEESLPREPLAWFNLRTFDDELSFDTVPVIYGADMSDIGKGDYPARECCLRIPIDIFGSAFFMLTRYEEIINRKRDEHDRFPAIASLAHRNGFFDRPIVDEYVEILWTALKRLWPALVRKQRMFSMLVSHDVDSPSRYGFLTLPRTIRAMGGDILLRGNIGTAIQGPWIRLKSSRQIHPADPYNTFDLIMDISERYGLVSAFYFICGRSRKNYDAQYEINHPAIRHLLKRIHERGHEIGLHPSYDTYQRPQAIMDEAMHLRSICAEEGIQQAKWGGRMHYLRWETPTTLYGWEQAGMSYDSTLGYADHVGFRCGTCHEYPAFDPVARRKFSLHIRPLIAMDCSVIGKGYRGLGVTPAAYDEFKKLKSACRAVGGTFTILWHNTQFTTQQERELYEAVIKA